MPIMLAGTQLGAERVKLVSGRKLKLSISAAADGDSQGERNRNQVA
jgi:hypothetical protein